MKQIIEGFNVCTRSALCMLTGDIIPVEEVIMVIAVILVSLIGIVLLLQGMIKKNYGKENCYYEIMAECIDVKVSYTKIQKSIREVYNPTYKIIWGEVEYILCNNIYTYQEYVVGEYYKIRINPENAEEFVDDNTDKDINILFYLGILFSAMGIISLLLIIRGYIIGY